MFVYQWNKRNAIFSYNISIIDEWWITLLIVLHILAFHHHTNKWYRNIHLINTHWVTSYKFYFTEWTTLGSYFLVLVLVQSPLPAPLGLVPPPWLGFLTSAVSSLFCLNFSSQTIYWQTLCKSHYNVHYYIYHTVYMIKTQFLKILNAISYNCIFLTVTMK